MGRLAVREPRAAECLDLIVDLMELRGIKTSYKDVQALRGRLVKAENERDHLAHTVWLRPYGSRGYFTQQTKGNWPNVPKHDIMRKKKITPELRIIIDFKKQEKELDEITDIVFRLSLTVARLLAASQEKSQ